MGRWSQPRRLTTAASPPTSGRGSRKASKTSGLVGSPNAFSLPPPSYRYWSQRRFSPPLAPISNMRRGRPVSAATWRNAGSSLAAPDLVGLHRPVQRGRQGVGMGHDGVEEDRGGVVLAGVERAARGRVVGRERGRLPVEHEAVDPAHEPQHERLDGSAADRGGVRARFMGGVHRLVLDGQAPARGPLPDRGRPFDPGKDDPAPVFLDTVVTMPTPWRPRCAGRCRPTRSGAAQACSRHSSTWRPRRACPCACWRSAPAAG